MWFSSGGTKSVLHYDDGLENINCLFAGTKELLFIDYYKYKHVVCYILIEEVGERLFISYVSMCHP